MEENSANPIKPSGYGEDYGKRLRTRVSWNNTAALGVVVAVSVCLAIWGPDTTNVAAVIGLLGTIAGMLVKNQSTIVDFLFGGSSTEKD